MPAVSSSSTTDDRHMSDDDAPPPPSEAPSDSVHKPRRRTWPWILLASVIVAPALLFALWAAITLNYSYSKGDRVGYVQKLSEKGWLCKTWEGELTMTPLAGSIPEKWPFTVPDDEVAQRIRALQGRQVALDYEERRGVPTSCFGETQYHVVGVREIQGAPITQPPPVTTPAAPKPAPPAGASTAPR
jgi:hypothetical protein